MPDDAHPLLRLLPPRTLERKRRRPSFPPPPARAAAQHAKGLRQGAEAVRQHLQAAVERFPQLATDVPYVRIQVATGTLLSDDELKAVGLIPVYRREDAILAAYSPERDLGGFESQLDSYARQTKKLAALAKIETILPWSRDDRTSARLRALGALNEKREYTVDVLLLPIEGAPANPQSPRAIERFVAGRQGRIVDRALERTFSALRIRLGGQALEDLLQYRDDIALVDLPPAAQVLVPQVLSLTMDALPEVPEPAPTAPAVCVVDSGILEGHPLLGQIRGVAGGERDAERVDRLLVALDQTAECRLLAPPATRDQRFLGLARHLPTNTIARAESSARASTGLWHHSHAGSAVPDIKTKTATDRRDGERVAVGELPTLPSAPGAAPGLAAGDAIGRYRKSGSSTSRSWTPW